jgi:hypothetical protein
MRAAAAVAIFEIGSIFPRSLTTHRITITMRTSKDVRLNRQRHAELLRSRIEELNQQLAILNSERGRFEKMLDGGREQLQ